MLDRLSTYASKPLGALAGAFGCVGVAALVLAPGWGEAPDAGYLAPLAAVPAEEYRVEILRAGTTFGEILYTARLDANEQENLLLAFQEHADPRRLSGGTEVTLRFLRGGEAVRGVDVAVTRDELVRLERDPFGWTSHVVPTPVWVDTLATTGTIETDLWTAVVGSDGFSVVPIADRAQVMYALAQVFQWQIDFHRQIQPGDSFRLIVEREVRPDGSMRRSRILAAEVMSSGGAVHAIWFDLHGDGVGGYYDLAGESLERPFLVAPLEFRRISSGFSNGRRHPILNVIRAHRGVDYAAAIGTPVMATGDGVVTRRGPDGGYGNLVEIRHSGGYVTRYGHLSRFRAAANPGTRVTQGQTIGYVGMTGLATGPHLHYEMYQNGRPRDPRTLDLPPGDPIPLNVRDRWTAEFVARYAMLVNLSSSPDLRVADTGLIPADSGAARNE